MPNLITNKFNLYVTFLFSLAGVCQDFDSDFLLSLPEATRAQLLNEIASNEQAVNNKLLKAPSTAINKNDNLSGKFGIDYFRTMQTTFMPINEPTFNPDYILGVGDSLRIQFAGQKNNILNLTINRDGSINFPELGKVNLAGLTLDKADTLLKELVKKSFVGVEVFTTLQFLKDMQILVVGEALYPGIYTVPGNSNILNILAAAGGFNEEASLRNIEIKRDGKILKKVDLYNAFIFGDFSDAGLPLRGGDTIFITTSKYEMRIQGGVRRPGRYELKDHEGYKELLSFANGYKNTAQLDEIQLTRVEDGKVNYSIINQAKLYELPLKHEDVIAIQTIDSINVKITGLVQRPGNYLLPESSSLIDLIEIAGGYKKNAYPFGGLYITNQAKENEKLSLKIAKQDLISFYSQIPTKSSTSHYDISLLLKEYESFSPLGRVSVDFSLQNLRINRDKYLLQNEDEIFIPAFQNLVHVFGDIENPGSFQFETEKRPNYYIQLAGSLKDSASRKIIIYHPNGTSEVAELSKFLGFGLNDISLYPGSLIYVPKKLELNIIEATGLYLPLVSNLAITLASIASLSNSTK